MIFLKGAKGLHLPARNTIRSGLWQNAGKPKAIPLGALNGVSAKIRSPLLAAEKYIRDKASHGEPISRADILQLGINTNTYNLIAKHLRDNYNYEIKRRHLKRPKRKKIIKLW